MGYKDRLIPAFSAYSQQALYPHTLRFGEKVVPFPEMSDKGYHSRLVFLSEQLRKEDVDWNSPQETVLRGFLMEFVSQSLLDALAYARSGDGDYTILPAHPVLDASLKKQKDKGADLVFAEKHTDGTKEVHALLDITSGRKTKNDLGFGINSRLGNTIPVIIVDFSDMEWVDSAGRQHDTKRYIHHVVRRSLQTGGFEDPYCGLSEERFPDILEEIQRRITRGCAQTRGVILRGKLDPQVKIAVLEKLQKTETILGANTHESRLRRSV